MTGKNPQNSDRDKGILDVSILIIVRFIILYTLHEKNNKASGFAQTKKVAARDRQQTDHVTNKRTEFVCLLPPPSPIVMANYKASKVVGVHNMLFVFDKSRNHFSTVAHYNCFA